MAVTSVVVAVAVVNRRYRKRPWRGCARATWYSVEFKELPFYLRHNSLFPSRKQVRIPGHANEKVSLGYV